MKHLIFIIAIILLSACHRASLSSNEVLTESDTVKVNLTYNKPIDGFTVNVTCFVDTTSNYDSPNTLGNRNAIVGRAYIHFKNDTVQFTVENPLFSDSTLMTNTIPLKNDIQISADYTPFAMPDNENKDIFTHYNQSPFFFYDIDFDGQKELIVTLWEGMEYHAHNAYEVYKIRNIKAGEILQPLKTPPFDRIDDYTLIDSVAKTISICKGVDAMKIEGYDTYRIK